ncbi:MAG: hypothetical protein GX589_04025 [Deltaproteobacteria bacterium]|nr:hypothetical protein [Deltaproteobacteria bacterium]
MRKLTVLAVLALLLAPALSQAKSLEDLLVEKGVITQGEASAAGAPKVWWEKGTRIDFPDKGFTVGVRTDLQTRYTFTDNAEGIPNSSSFDVKRARVNVSGTALNKEFSYLLSSDFARTAQLKDFYLQWHTTECTALKMGQFKPAISRQYNSSKTTLQFPDRSIANEVFHIERQPGLSGYMDLLEDSPLRVTAQVFNGESDDEGINQPGVDTRQTGVIAARWAAMGNMDPFVEGDIGWTEEPALNLGAAYSYSDAQNESDEFEVKSTIHRVSADVSFKQAGLSVQGEFYWGRAEAKDDEYEAHNLVGFYTQAGYFIMPKELELAARYSYVDCDDGKAVYDSYCVGNKSLDGVDVSINYYFWEHYLKAQLAWAFLREDPVGDEDRLNINRWMLQLSAMF